MRGRDSSDYILREDPAHPMYASDRRRERLAEMADRTEDSAMTRIELIEENKRLQSTINGCVPWVDSIRRQLQKSEDRLAEAERKIDSLKRTVAIREEHLKQECPHCGHRRMDQ